MGGPVDGCHGVICGWQRWYLQIRHTELQGCARADGTGSVPKTGLVVNLVKRALWVMDNSVGASRQPALLPDPEQDKQIEAILKKYELL